MKLEHCNSIAGSPAHLEDKWSIPSGDEPGDSPTIQIIRNSA